MTTWKTRITKRINLKTLSPALSALSLSAASLCVDAAINLKVLHDFNTAEGFIPTGQLAQGRDGWLYGTTISDVAFKIKPDGADYTLVHAFSSASPASPEGFLPTGGLTLGRDGNFYGATLAGGSNGSGTIFKLTPRGNATALFAFSSTTLNTAIYPPIQAPDGHLYGTTRDGGKFGLGAVYKLNLTTKTLSILHHFRGGKPDGSKPYAPLLFARDGNLYGTTRFGGASWAGTVFRINPNGANYKVLYNFALPKGIWPLGPLAQGNDGNLYGATFSGGTNRADSSSGTLYKLTPQGVHTTLHAFDSIKAFAHGAGPATGVTLDSDGNLYGATHFGGHYASDCGVLFKTSTLRAYSALYAMNKQLDGCFNERLQGPQSSLSLHTNGRFYGVATVGGTSASDEFVSDGKVVNRGFGTLFRLGNGLRPFIKPDIDAAKVGATVGLLGDFTGVTKVTFNGINASFTKVSPTFITAKVPVGAKTGAIIVTKGAAKIKSLKNFVVRP